ALDLMPRSARRIIGKSPNSSSVTVRSAVAGDSHMYRCFNRVMSRVRPRSSGTNSQAHELSGFSHTSHRFAANALTRNEVVGLTVFAIGIQSPTLTVWNSGTMRSGLMYLALSSSAYV